MDGLRDVVDPHDVRPIGDRKRRGSEGGFEARQILLRRYRFKERLAGGADEDGAAQLTDPKQ